MKIGKIFILLTTIFVIMAGSAMTNAEVVPYGADFISTGLPRTVTLNNSCSIELCVGASGKNMMKRCSSSNDCGGGACSKDGVCLDIYCGSNADCSSTNAYCGGIASYKGTCQGKSQTECGSNRFCDTSNKSYYPYPGGQIQTCKSAGKCGDTSFFCDMSNKVFYGSNKDCPNKTDAECITAHKDNNAQCDVNTQRCFVHQCSQDCPNKTDAECISAHGDANSQCDTNYNRCFFYQCGWQTCHYIPIPVVTSDFVSPQKDCSSNADCAAGTFCYTTTTLGLGKCSKLPTEGNGWFMAAGTSSITVEVPAPWGGRFWPRTGCAETCQACPDAFCQTNADCTDGRTCKTGDTPQRSSSCTETSQCNMSNHEICDTSVVYGYPETGCDDYCQTDADCNARYATDTRVPGPDGQKHMKCVQNTISCGGYTATKNWCGFHQCSKYMCTAADKCNCSFTCDTGQCLGFDGKNFSKYCGAPGMDSPTLAEIFSPGRPGIDFYDVSLVDGGNVPLQIAPTPSSYDLNNSAGTDQKARCKTDLDCRQQKNDLAWSCEKPNGQPQGYCVNRFWCSSPGCVSGCSQYGYGSLFTQNATWNTTAPFAISESVCPAELQLRKNNKYVGCVAPKDACGGSNPSPLLKCNDPVTGQGTYLDLYKCVGANVNSCYNDSVGQDPKCCGCPEWVKAIDAKFCYAGTNLLWEANAQPYYRIFHDAAPTAYTYPYDDKSGTFTCTGDATKSTDVNYTIIFCPK